MIEKLDRQAWAALTKQVAGELARVFTPSRTTLGSEGQKLVSKALGKASLSSSRSVQDIANIVCILDAAGNRDAAVAAADALRHVPFTGNQTIFEPIRQVFALIFRRLMLEGSPEVTTYEQLLSFAENGGESGPPVVRAATERRLAGMLLRHYAHEDLTSGSRANNIANVCTDIRELALMWAFGGSTAWPRPRIDEEYAICADALKRLGALP